MKNFENLRKDVINWVNLEDYPEKLIDNLSIKQSIRNIFRAEKPRHYKDTKLEFVDWFCGLPSCFTYPCGEFELEELFLNYGFTVKEIENMEGMYNLEKLALWLYVIIF